MNALPSTHERARLRRSLVQLASLLVLTLLACGLVSLFALWSMEKLHSNAETRQAVLLRAANEARSAQVSFKIQVQSWKNILLRGTNAADFAVAEHEFEASESAADFSLRSVMQWAQTVHDDSLTSRIDDAIALHAQLGSKYRAAMPDSSLTGAIRERADSVVRGIDRPLNTALDQLVNDMLATEVRHRTQARDEDMIRFATLSKAIWISLGLSLLLIAVLLWRMLRDPALRA